MQGRQLHGLKQTYSDVEKGQPLALIGSSGHLEIAVRDGNAAEGLQIRFGDSVVRRGLGAFAGGIVAMFGARMADGCPSGHGMSGLMQLSLSGFIALACFFGAGVLMAGLVYRGKGGVR
jgi:uncharacterized membrane protein YedE/YeeE